MSSSAVAGAMVAGSAVALTLFRARSRRTVSMATIEDARNSAISALEIGTMADRSSGGDGPSERPSPSLKAGLSKLRSAANKVVVARRMDSSYAVPETIFDSPLQQAMHVLQSLVDGLEESGDPELAAMAQRAVKLLHSKNLQQAPTIEVSDVDETAAEWLKSTNMSVSLQMVGKSNSAPTMVRRSGYAKQPAVLNPRFSVLPANEAKLLQLLEHGITSWEFDALQLDALSGGHALSTLGWALFERHGLRQTFDISVDTLCSFLAGLEASYRRVPYHGQQHGACVTQGAHFFVTSEALRGVIATPLDMLSLLFGALVHDVNHDAKNNAFHSATASDLALLYSDQSVLEMHHLATAFRLLRKPECNIAAKLSRDDARTMRTTVISMVLATDLAKNFEVINAFKTMLEPADAQAAAGGGGAQLPPPPPPPPRTRNDERFVSGAAPLFSSNPATVSADEKAILLKLAVKCADIGNVCKGRATALAWTDRVIQEFYAQGDEERALGLEVSHLNDRHTANTPKNQLGFYNFIVRPMYDAFGLLVDLSVQQQNLDEMQQHWSAEMLPEEQTRCGIAASRGPSSARTGETRSSRTELGGGNSARLTDDDSARKASPRDGPSSGFSGAAKRGPTGGSGGRGSTHGSIAEAAPAPWGAPPAAPKPKRYASMPAPN